MKKLVLIGGTGGIGSALQRCIDRTKYDVTVVSKEIFDVTYSPCITAISDADVVVNLAAVYYTGGLDKWHIMSLESIKVNCMGAVNILSKVLPGMRERKYGRIVLVSSVFSQITVPETGVYSASKAFVDKLANVAAIENAQYGITVNSIQIGYTGLGMGMDVDAETYEKSRNKPAMKRFCSPEEIYRTIDYIVDTEYFTGQSIRLDGGIK